MNNLYSNLVLYRNELKNRNIPKYKIIGIVSEMILSKEIFKRNTDVKQFILRVFEIEYKDYIVRSRTMILAKTVRFLSVTENYSNYCKKLAEVINEVIKNSDKDLYKGNNFNGWIK